MPNKSDFKKKNEEIENKTYRVFYFDENNSKAIYVSKKLPFDDFIFKKVKRKITPIKMIKIIIFHILGSDKNLAFIFLINFIVADFKNQNWKKTEFTKEELF